MAAEMHIRITIWSLRFRCARLRAVPSPQALPGGTERENQKTNPEMRRKVFDFSGIHYSNITYFIYVFPVVLCHKDWISYQSLCRRGAPAVFYRFHQFKTGKIAQGHSRETT